MEKRAYSRIKVNIGACVYGSDGIEADAYIQDISEEGFKLEVNEDSYDAVKTISVGDAIDIQFMDFVAIFKSKTEYILSCEAEVRHVEREGKNITLGCKTKSKDFCEYVSHKKCSQFIIRGIDMPYLPK